MPAAAILDVTLADDEDKPIPTEVSRHGQRAGHDKNSIARCGTRAEVAVDVCNRAERGAAWTE